jgi:hypothetical protein
MKRTVRRASPALCPGGVKLDRRGWYAIVAAAVAAAVPSAACADLPFDGFEPIGANVQKRANAVLALMGYSLTPDVTTGSLAISDATASNPGFRLTTLGGGFTWSRELPLYMEGTAAYSRYDPTFVATNGQESRTLPAKWNSVTGTAGIGWDFFLTDELRLRPIFNFSLGRVTSDLSVASAVIERVTDTEIDFLQQGKLNAIGTGGSLMLDYEHYRTDYEIDVELRYTNIYIRTTSGTSAAVQGNADTQSAGLWARWRQPTGLNLLDRPLRYVLEFSHSRYMGEESAVLGVDYLSAVGAGLELDSSKYPIVITRTRLMFRYLFSPYAHGTSIGLAVSF